jgi:predicted nucleotidyltransferase
MIRDRQAILEHVRSYYAENDVVRLVLVFGSVAKDAYGDESDVDVAIAGNSAFTYEDLLAMKAELSSALDRLVDIVDLRAAEGLILKEAITNGLRVKLDRALFVELHIKALIYAEDFLPVKRAMQNARIARFIHGS